MYEPLAISIARSAVFRAGKQFAEHGDTDADSDSPRSFFPRTRVHVSTAKDVVRGNARIE